MYSATCGFSILFVMEESYQTMYKQRTKIRRNRRSVFGIAFTTKVFKADFFTPSLTHRTLLRTNIPVSVIMNGRLILYNVLLSSLLLKSVFGQQPTVDYNLGTLIGKTKAISDGTRQYFVNTFLGIPFAKPPTGNLRLRKPEPLEILDSNPYNATYFRPYCVQGFAEKPAKNGVEDEDCLYLNVYVPNQAPDRTPGHAVMVWVYGGGFFAGASNPFDGSMLAAVGNVIIVTVSYRLSFFGFFSTMDSLAPGNYGLFDQAMSFQWVRENIAAFGGDNQRVTIFGQSAGGMSVDLHGLYPNNVGLFQRIITQSGVATAPYLDLTRDRMPSVYRLATALNCTVGTTHDVIECLRWESWEAIKSAVLKITSHLSDWDKLFFMPVIDNDFIKVDYSHLEDFQIEAADCIEFYKHLDVLHGANQYDGGASISFVVGSFGSLNSFMPTQEDLLQDYINYVRNLSSSKLYPENIRRSILHEYTNWTNPTSYESVRLQIAKLITDVIFAVPVTHSSQIHSANGTTGTTYAYKFMPKASGRMSQYSADWLPGADHGEDLAFVFGFRYNNMQDLEKKLTLQMMTYWSNFAKSGLVLFSIYI